MDFTHSQQMQEASRQSRVLGLMGDSHWFVRLDMTLFLQLETLPVILRECGLTSHFASVSNENHIISLYNYVF